MWDVFKSIKTPLPERKPTSSSGLMMPNWTLLMRRNGHALSPEGGPCILSIQRDASSLGTPLCEQEQPEICHQDSSRPPTVTGKSPKAISQGPLLSVILGTNLLMVWSQVICLSTAPLSFSGLHSGAFFALVREMGPTFLYIDWMTATGFPTQKNRGWLVWRRDMELNGETVIGHTGQAHE